MSLVVPRTKMNVITENTSRSVGIDQLKLNWRRHDGSIHWSFIKCVVESKSNNIISNQFSSSKSNWQRWKKRNITIFIVYSRNLIHSCLPFFTQSHIYLYFHSYLSTYKWPHMHLAWEKLIMFAVWCALSPLPQSFFEQEKHVHKLK